MLPLGNTCHGLSYVRVPTVTDKGIPVSSSYCIFSALREKHGFEFKRQEKLHPNTFPTFRAWRTHTKTKRHKLVLKRRKMALKQSKFMGTTRNTFSSPNNMFSSKRQKILLIIAVLKNDTFSAHQGGIGIDPPPRRRPQVWCNRCKTALSHLRQGRQVTRLFILCSAPCGLPD